MDDDIRSEQTRATTLTLDDAMFTAVMEQAVETILVTDTEQVVRYVNLAFTHATGYRGDEVIGQPLVSFLGEARYSSLGLADKATPTVGEVWRGRIVSARKSGTTFEEDVTITPIRDVSGQTIAYVRVGRDVTREMSLQSKLFHLQKMEALGRLAGGVAHELNNRLTVVNTTISLLMARFSEDAEAVSDCRDIVDAVHRSKELTQQLLTFSRHEATRTRAVNLKELIGDAEKMYRRTIGEHILIILAIDPDIPCVIIDPGQFEQVLLNLVINARDAMSSGGMLEICAKEAMLTAEELMWDPSARPGRYVVISVKDTGCGMTPDVKERAFEPFFTTKESGRGTGLGLATVYGIVEQAGGYVFIDSEPGKGTTVRAYLQATDDLPSQIPTSLVPESARGNNEIILVVEDDPVVRRSTARMLKQSGYRVLQAGDGKEGLWILNDSGKDVRVVLSDVIMPTMSGGEFAKRVRQLHPHVRIVFMSGFTGDNMVEQGVLEKDQTYYFVQKPFNGEDLLRVIQRAVRRAAGQGSDPVPSGTL
ncbi:hypothetical protein A3E39_01660 [Candidatus Uhrbacteria bacterium RIFCSPHIGHO2_12_FULL_60_25]|uniref:histidine kinase n=1 Tax=Candidatus Uhrbacteria bacterium RIFCSPHIGHO2_12_FULL_60_25 TaxID=1802399 RepID=A0A1F7UK05_9BACT|nr:MAG: hypothetical protein A3D73_01830 [Candidatus Uhrbacteria bacterium RIFCSPHIGHO2_02_FULL_60_44]OGL78623.1 MAG: hypothetical protein A3E39_01660 [Candidatus Uhrbacteria bacterium RIFCSPHIGHO2_12_FULL_60_25]